jgi:hypothetical protein
MLAMLGALIAIGAGIVFGALGLLTLWGGLVALRSELPSDYRRTQANRVTRLTTTLLIALPLLVTAAFGLLAAGRLFQMVVIQLV